MSAHSNDLFDIVRWLCDTVAVDALPWAIEGHDKYSVEIPNALLVVGAKQGAEGGGDNPLYVELRTRDDKLIDVEDVSAEHQQYGTVRRLLDAAASHKRTLVQDVANTLKKAYEATGGVAVVLPPSPPAPPPAISQWQMHKVLQRMKGRWRLEWPDGSENVEIRENGDYFVLKGYFRKGVTGTKPVFKLAVLSYDEVSSRVEIAKEVGTRTRQIEVLTISDDEMKGYAKHDEHALVYRRQR